MRSAPGRGTAPRFASGMARARLCGSHRLLSLTKRGSPRQGLAAAGPAGIAEPSQVLWRSTAPTVVPRLGRTERSDGLSVAVGTAGSGRLRSGASSLRGGASGRTGKAKADTMRTLRVDARVGCVWANQRAPRTSDRYPVTRSKTAMDVPEPVQLQAIPAAPVDVDHGPRCPGHDQVTGAQVLPPAGMRWPLPPCRTGSARLPDRRSPRVRAGRCWSARSTGWARSRSRR